MNLYDAAFLLLIAGCGFLTWQQYKSQEKTAEEKLLTGDRSTPQMKHAAATFSRLFLTVYCLVMASDWLQGTLSFKDIRSEERRVGKECLE